MSIQKTGPGGVSASYGRRVSSGSKYDLTKKYSDVVTVKSDTEPGVATSGVDSALSKPPYLSIGFSGRLTTTATAAADHTSHNQFTFETPPGLLRVGVMNNIAVALTGVKVAYAPSSALGVSTSTDVIDPTATGGVWISLPFAGSTAGATIAAATAVPTPAIDNPTITFSDWITGGGTNPLYIPRTDGGTLAVGNVRVEIPGAANANIPLQYFTDTNAFEQEGSATVAPWGRPYRCRSQAVLGVTTKNLFTSVTVNGQTVPIVIQYVPFNMVSGATVGVLGNSMEEGVLSGATGRRPNYILEARARISTPERPLEVVNSAIHGAAASRANGRATNFLPLVKPEIVVYPWYNVNSAQYPGASAATALVDQAAMIGNFNLGRVNMEAFQPALILTTGIPSNFVARPIVEMDKLRLARNEALLAAPQSARVRVADVATPFSGPIDTNGQTSIAAGFTSDQLHDSDLGRAALAGPLASAFQLVR